MKKISKSILGVTGEYYVAAELGKRNIYAQLTLGNQKRTDLLIFSEIESKSKLLKIEVKCKQGKTWPNCKGINQKDSFIVFVDFKDLESNHRPDFYVLSEEDWRILVEKKRKESNEKYPDRKAEIKDNVLIRQNVVNKQKAPHKGTTVKLKDIESHKENWEKISKLIE